MSKTHPLVAAIGAQFALGTAYYFVGRHRILAPQGFHKLIGAVALSAIIHTSRRFIEEKDSLENQSLKLMIGINLASIATLGAGAYFAKTSLKTALLSTAFFCVAQSLITDYFLFPEIITALKKLPREIPSSKGVYIPPSFPTPADYPLEEAMQVHKVMKDGPLKEKAAALIALSELRLSENQASTYDFQITTFEENSLASITYLCGAAKLFSDTSLIDNAFSRAKSLVNNHSLANRRLISAKDKNLLYSRSRSACMIAIAYAHREIDPSVSVDRYLDQCNRDDNEVKHWIGRDLDPSKPISKAKNKDNDLPTPEVPSKTSSSHHMTQFEFFLKEKSYDEALAETRKDTANLYWRVEALCRIAEAEQGH